MKRDGRTFDHQTLETIRLMAVERVREGEPASEVIEAYGFNRTTIYKWIQAALRPGVRQKVLPYGDTKDDLRRRISRTGVAPVSSPTTGLRKFGSSTNVLWHHFGI